MSEATFDDKEKFDGLTFLLDAETAAALCDLLCKNDTVTPSVLQKSLHIGYAMASCIMDDLRRIGIIDPAEDSSQSTYGKIHKEKINSLFAYN